MTYDNLAIIDVETTGGSSSFDRIIEVGVLRIENNKIVKKFETLINPQTVVSPFIEKLTGISSQSLENAPTFYEIKDELKDLLKDSIFVAHNARFDYSFIKNEFKRLEMDFRAKQLCTVKFSRLLFPKYRRHSLDNVIERFGIECVRRHRALDDAQVVWEFIKKAPEFVDEERIKKAYFTVMKKPSLPPLLLKGEIEKLPEAPGVYLFYGEGELPLYIGKSINIYDRVLSHFNSDTDSSRELEISQQVKRIETIKTAGELSALILESELVKKMQPVYNRRLRYSSRLTYLEKKENTDGYFTINIKTTNEIEVNELENVLAVVKSQKQAKEMLSNLIKEFSLCETLLGLNNSKGACFSYHLGWCKGACMKKEKKEIYNSRFVLAFVKTKLSNWPFSGPIIVKEKFEEIEEGLVFDKWCYLGTYEEVKNSEKNVDMTLSNFDVYKILRGFLKNDANMKKISMFRELRENNNGFEQFDY